jgi:Predicted thioesterase
MVGKKVIHHLMMKGSDGHYAGGLVNGARIIDMWGDVGTELMVYVDGDISLFLGYKNIVFTAPVYVGDFMEYHGWIENVGNCSYTCKFEAYKVATMCDRTDMDMTDVASTAATACIPPILCATATGSLYISKDCQRGPQELSFKNAVHTSK